MARFLVLACAGVGSAHAVDFDVAAGNGITSGELAGDYVNGTIGPIQYGITGGASILTLRSKVPVICARKRQLSANKYLVVDPNGYYQDTSVQYLPPVDELLALNMDPVIDAPLVSWIRGSDGVTFGQTTFVAGGEDPLLFISNVDALCTALPDVDTPPAAAGACPGAVASTDGIFDNRFEAPSGDGELSVSSRVVSSDIAWLTYEHVLSAEGGPVSALRLREQFAHASLPGGQPVFKHSLGMASGWNCQATEGATCGSDGATGLGYIRLDNVNLAANTCIKITATRPRRSDGVEMVPFSGRIFTAAFYERSVGQSYVSDIATTRLKYTQ